VVKSLVEVNPTQVIRPAFEMFQVLPVPSTSTPEPVEVNCKAAPEPELVTVNVSFEA